MSLRRAGTQVVIAAASLALVLPTSSASAAPASPGQVISIELDFVPLRTSTLIDLEVSAVFPDGSISLG